MWGEASKATMTGYASLQPGLTAIVFLNPRLTNLLVLLFACASMLSVFLAFHCYIVSIGVTTNEYYKWKELSIKHEPRSKGGTKDEEAAPAGTSTSAAGGNTTPRNSYNLGVLANIREVFSPRSLQKKVP